MCDTTRRRLPLCAVLEIQRLMLGSGPQDPCSPITLKQQVGEILQALQALRAFFELHK